ncbi:MAG: hypothetical protein ABIK89_01770 [Planctomycetota bacterium]
MRRTTGARNRSRRQSAVGVSLFPFLVVLICTMGALILLLVVIARQARVQAAEDAALKTAGIQKDLKNAREWVDLEVSEYQFSREKTEAQLAEARLALGHVEDHARRLRDELARLEANWNELKGLDADRTGRRDELEAELARLRSQIADSERELAEAREVAQRSDSYAVVPYAGPNATRRRPIYIECRREGVVLEPEGIVLGEDDFAGPLGSGNPLDVALRAIREYLLRQRNANGEDAGEPYPLVLVRPDGIGAYYAAREAMKTWAWDFGYELIGQDWKLDFQPPDPALAEEVRLAVQTARVRQQRLIAAAPGRYGPRAREGFVASPYRGGFVPQPESNDGRSGYGARGSFNRFGNQFASADEGGEVQTSGDDDAARAATGAESSPGKGDSGAASFGQRPESLAKARGRNWGLPNATEAAVPITSPIRIDCFQDRLVLVPEKGLGQSRVVTLGDRTEDSIDELISAVWEYMDRWGTAGTGMYWRPVLSVCIAPYADSRYTDLEALLDGSGLEVKRNDEG